MATFASQKRTRTVGKQVLGLLVGTITDVGHLGKALELAALPTIDALGPPPALLQDGVKDR